MSSINRREFVAKSAAITAAASAAAPTVLASENWKGANDRIRVAVAGIRSRGKNHIDGFQKLKNVEVTALCDIDQRVLDDNLNDF